MVIAAPAKVNLFLRVLGRRADGFHDLDTLFQALDLCDEVRLEPRDTDIELIVEGAELGRPEDNLVTRAARAFFAEIGDTGGVRIRLRKRIPAGGGLGGGSSDAAATLRALNHRAGRPLGEARLVEMGAALGSDVPFFLGSSPLARGRGRGERLRALPPLPVAHVVVVLPPVHVATGPAFAALARARADGVGASSSTPSHTTDPRAWSDVEAMAHNDFEEVVPALFPEVGASLDALRRSTGGGALLSGSGGACFGIARSAEAAAVSASLLEHTLGWPALATTTLTRWPEPRAPGGLEPPAAPR